MLQTNVFTRREIIIARYSNVEIRLWFTGDKWLCFFCCSCNM